MATFLFVLLFMHCLSFHLTHSKRFSRAPKCGNTKHFRFDEELPTYHSGLSYCQYYRGETCCNTTHTDKIVKQIYGYHGANVSDACRAIALNIGCSPCDPRVATNQLKGICVNYCDDWYAACRNDYFHYNQRGLLTACPESELVCSKLSAVLTNGTQLCEHSGFEVSYTSITCYDGMKSKFIPPPADSSRMRDYYSIHALLRRLQTSAYQLLLRYKYLPRWQQVMWIAAIAYLLLALYKVLQNAYVSMMGTQQSSSSVVNIPSGIFDSDTEKEKMRKARIQNIAMSQQMEAQFAQALGLTGDRKRDNEEENDNSNGDDDDDDDDSD